MNGGGFWDKLGNEYEHDYVCLLWLRLLAEQLDSVTWEPRGPDEPGVDVWFEREGQRTAVQCKSRSGGQWNVSALISGGFLRPAGQHLTREDGATRFRFVTTQSAPPLSELTAWAKDGGTATKSAEKVAAELAHDAETSIEPRELAGRMEVELLTELGLGERTLELSISLAGDDGPKLVQALVALRIRTVTRDTLSSAQLRAMLPRIAWRASIDSRMIQEEAARRCRSFVDDAFGARRIRTPIARVETRRLLNTVSKSRAPRVMLVHGNAGAGKSDVIASFVHECAPEHGLIVAVRADECAQLLDGPIALKKLMRVAGEDGLILVVDQLDQLLQGGNLSETHLRAASELLREARNRCRVIVGCRTVDSEQDARLSKLLHGSQGLPAERLLVGDLPEADVTAALSSVGIAWTSLGIGVQRLVRLPVCLGFILDLVAVEGWHGVRSLHDFVQAWWRHVVDENESLATAMDALVKRMELDGSLAVDRRLLADHEPGLRALQRAGVLQQTSDSRLRPVHQVLVDMLSARRIGGCADTAKVLELLGPRPQQAIADARRLRHAVPLFLARDAAGAKIVDNLYHSSEIRPLLERALLMGLADDVAEPTPHITRVVLGWLANGQDAAAVGTALLYGRGAWVRACREWVEKAWKEGDLQLQDTALRILGSVSAQDGDLVAELLENWMKSDPDTLERAHWIFFQDPSHDTDRLFELRQRATARAKDRHFDWKRLFASHPERAAVLLALEVRKLTAETLTGLPDFRGSEVPTPEVLTSGALSAADRLWREMRDWWTTLQVESITSISTKSDDMPPAPLVDCVAILGRCLGHLVNEGKVHWDGLLGDLPDPLRTIDGWLLLEVGAHLDGRNLSAIEAASNWLTQNDWVVDLHVGWDGRPSEYRLVRPFVRAVVPHLSNGGFANLERWLLEYQETWTTEEELRRLARANKHGLFWPNSRGLLNYRILPEIPEGRVTEAIRVRLDEICRKFDKVRETMLSSLESTGGWVRSKFPDDVARRFTPERWQELLREAPARGEWAMVDGGIETYDLETVGIQLSALAQQTPGELLPVAEAIAAINLRPDADSLYSNLLHSISGTSRPGSAEESTWAPLDDDVVERLLLLPAFFEVDACAIDIGRIVRERPGHPWSRPVIERLVEIAATEMKDEGDPVLAASGRGNTLTHIQLNDAACTALRALAMLASKHTDQHVELLDTAEGLVDRYPSARRAAAGILAMCCDGTSPTRARRALLRACKDPRVAADRDCLGALFWIIAQPDTTSELLSGIESVLYRLPQHGDPEIAQQGGVALAVLRDRDILSHDKMLELSDSYPAARRGLARQLAPLLFGSTREEWRLEYALVLADDEEYEVGNAILFEALSTRSRAELRNDDFAARLLQTRAAKRHRDRIVHAFDDEAHLTPVAPILFELSEQLVAVNGDANDHSEPWKRYDAARGVSGLLERLVEECKKNGDRELGMAALDHWDLVIESHPIAVGSLIAAHTDPRA